LAQSTDGVFAPTTYLVVSLKNGAPGSSSAVRPDQAGANISKVLRPNRIAEELPVMPARVSPIFGSKPYSNVKLGSSNRPSRERNSCAWIWPMVGFPSGHRGAGFGWHGAE